MLLILCNLISNVEKYAADGKSLLLETSQREEGASVVSTITVSDHGAGIPDQHREQVFKPFWRAGDQLSDAAGTGIGLSISRDLARLHGGDLILLNTHPGCQFQTQLRTPRAAPTPQS